MPCRLMRLLLRHLGWRVIERTWGRRLRIAALGLAIMVAVGIGGAAMRLLASSRGNRPSEEQIVAMNTSQSAGNGNVQAVADSLRTRPEEWAHHESKDFEISFDYPANGILSEWQDASENLHVIDLHYDQLSSISISYELNPNAVSVEGWFGANRDQYNDLIMEIGKTEIRGNPALFLGLPDTCRSVPLVVAIIGHNDRIFRFIQFESASRQYAEELGQILGSISFAGHNNGTQPICRDYLRYPAPPPGVVCP